MRTHSIISDKVKMASDIQKPLIFRTHSKHISSSNSPLSSKSLIKRFINEKIPTPKSKTGGIMGFDISFCNIHKPSKTLYKEKLQKELEYIQIKILIQFMNIINIKN